MKSLAKLIVLIAVVLGILVGRLNADMVYLKNGN